ncbi:MAG: HD domain-containing protein [Thermodesulfobacteriota bacterium]
MDQDQRPWSRLANHPALHALERLARQNGQHVWLTGGTLRDLILGREPPDLDLTADGDALALGRQLGQRLGRRFVVLKAEHATGRLPLADGGCLDLVGLRAADLEADLRRRDFSLNALAAPLAALLAGRVELIDPTGGLADLAARRLRLAGPNSLADDPLRVLRAFRFMASHGLRPAPGLLGGLAAAGPGLFRVARERVGQEWLKLMAGPRAPQALMAMERAQVLTRLVPALAAGRGVWQNPYHHLDVLRHHLAACLHLTRLARGRPALPPPLSGEADEYLAQPRRRALLMTAALLHDLGKPATRRDEAEPGWRSFHRHDIVGARLAERAVRGLGLAKADAAWVAFMVAGHMRPFHLMGAEQRQGLGPRPVRRLLAAAGQDLTGLFLLALADTRAGRGPLRPPDAEERLVALWGRVAHLRDRELAAALAAPPLLDGHRLMAELGLEPGPQVGRLLAFVRAAQLDGRATTSAEALELARQRLARSPSPGGR